MHSHGLCERRNIGRSLKCTVGRRRSWKKSWMKRRGNTPSGKPTETFPVKTVWKGSCLCEVWRLASQWPKFSFSFLANRDFGCNKPQAQNMVQFKSSCLLLLFTQPAR